LRTFTEDHSNTHMYIVNLVEYTIEVKEFNPTSQWVLRDFIDVELTSVEVS